MADYAAQIEVRSDGEAEREKITNRTTTKCDYLANSAYPEAANFYATLQVNRELMKASSVWF